MNSDRSVRVLNLGAISNVESQSIYHAIADSMTVDSPDTIVLCVPKEPYFCLGFHQSSLRVIDPKGLQRYRFPVMRRSLGGGLTYLDDQQIFYQCIFHKSRSPSIPRAAFKARLQAPIRTLNRIGLSAGLFYTNEIEVAGRRIAGIGGGQIGEAHVVVGNILNDFDYEAMARIIRAPCEKFREFALAAMRKRITTLMREGRSNRWQDLPELLIDEYQKSVDAPVFFGRLSSQEQEASMRRAALMTSPGYLEQRDHCEPDQPQLITDLKISGSASVLLFRYDDSLKSGYLIIIVHKGIVRQVARVRELSKEYSDDAFHSAIPEVKLSDVQVGGRLSELLG